MKIILLILLSFVAATSLSLPNLDQATLSSDEAIEKYLIELAPEDTKWVTEDEKWALRRVRSFGRTLEHVRKC